MTPHRYKAWNAAMATTAALASVSTGTAIKTMLQIAPPATRQLEVIAWGYSLDDPPGADAVIELLQTDVAATVTAHSASGIQPIGGGNTAASLVTLGVSATGFTASAEGSITATRSLDTVSVSSTSAEAAPILTYAYQFLPDERPIIDVSKFLRVRATTPTTAVDMRCWVLWGE